MKSTKSGWGLACVTATVAVSAFTLGRATTDAPGGVALAGQPEGEAAPPSAPRPGKMHEHLKRMLGTWEGTVRFRTGPGQEWTESPGKVRRELAMDGLFVLEHVTGEADGQEFKGMGIVGYNELKKLYETVWIENMSTHMTFSTGSYDPATQVWTFEGEMIDPTTGQAQTVVTTMDKSDPRREVMIGHAILSDGSKERIFEGNFVRK